MYAGARSVALALLLLLAPALGAAWSPLHEFSRVDAQGPYAIAPVEDVWVESFDGVRLHAGLWRPVAPEGTQVPVILTVGPYFGLGEPEPANVPGSRLGRFLIENFVPHGYAVAQVSVRGTGESGGCMDFFGPAEQEDMDALVTWFGTRAWSNGNVALAGKSYDGTTPWMAAASGNPHLKTIVPIAGITSVPELMYHNGSSELRGPIMAHGVYWPYSLGLDPLSTKHNPDRSPEARVEGAACPALADHAALHLYTSGTGDWEAQGASDYWTVRDFRQRVLDNYGGSVFIVHGLRDWNVDPYQVAPFFSDLQVEKKMWLGQWGHDYPDREESFSAERFDFANVLLAWFDKHLKGMDVDTGPVVEVYTLAHGWNTHAQWPPAGVTMQALALTAHGGLDASPGAADEHLLAANLGLREGGRVSRPLVYTSEPFAQDTRIAGLPQLPLEVTPLGTGGHVYVELEDVSPWGWRIVIGYGWMNLRHHEGGNEEQTVVPGERITARVELQPMDALVAAGHRLRLEVWQEAMWEPLPSPESTGLLVHVGEGGSVLRLPVNP